MSKKTYTLCICEAISTIREYTFEKSFDHENDVDAYLQEIVNSGVVPDEIQEEASNELSYESEMNPPAIHGARDRFPGMSAGIVEGRNGYIQKASADTRYQLAFTWRVDRETGELQTWPLGYDEGAISGNVLIAQPCTENWILPSTPEYIRIAGVNYGTRFYRSGDGRVWEVLFAFQQPETV